MEAKQTCLMNSQETWMERFNRVSEENIALMATLENRSDDMRKLMAEKTALARERDELLAMLDVQERQRFESLHSASSEEEYNEYTSAELAVLGACRCRVKSPEPCGCAHAAAKLKMEITKLKLQKEQQTKLYEEATITTDAYRIAFEEQLDRNRQLMKEIVHMTMLPTPTAKMSKAKSAVKWFINQLNDDDPPNESRRDSKRSKSSMSSPTKTDTNHTSSQPKPPPASSQPSTTSPQPPPASSQPSTTSPQPPPASLSSPAVEEKEETSLTSEQQPTTNPSASPTTAAQCTETSTVDCDRTTEQCTQQPTAETSTGSTTVRQQSTDAGIVPTSNHDSTAAGAPTPTDTHTAHTTTPKPSPLANKTELELVQMLTDMIADRSEALGHQRLAARMLALKTQELENKLHKMGADDVFDKEKSKT